MCGIFKTFHSKLEKYKQYLKKRIIQHLATTFSRGIFDFVVEISFFFTKKEFLPNGPFISRTSSTRVQKTAYDTLLKNKIKIQRQKNIE